VSATHTPGPWVVFPPESCEVVDASKRLVASAFYGDQYGKWNIGLTQANARLIAAAPDLLEVLQDLKESASYWGEYDVPIGIVDRINAAIAKATGEAA